MKIKGKTLEQTYELYQNFDPFTSPRQSAIHLYTGVVFEGLELSSYTPDQIKYLNEHVRILSAMYGVLKPSDCIYPYRLDFTMRFKDLNLMRYWREAILEEFKDEDVIIDLASQEFSQFLKPLKEKVHRVEFVDVIKGKEKVISFKAKQMRGLMLDYLIKQKDVEKINNFKSMYSFDKNYSKSQYYRFLFEH